MLIFKTASIDDIHLEEVIPGRGHVDYRTYLRELSGLGRDVPLILEHLQTAEEQVSRYENRLFLFCSGRPQKTMVYPGLRYVG